MTKSRTIRWVLLVSALRSRLFRLAALQWFRGRTKADERAEIRGAKARHSRHHAPVEKADFPVYLTWARTVQASIPYWYDPHRRSDRQDRFPGRPTGQSGHLPGRDDPRPVPGDARSGQGQEGRRMKPTSPLPIGSAALHQARRGRNQTADRHAASTVAQLTAQIAADDAAISNARPSSTTPGEGADLRSSPACVRSTSATSSLRRRKQAS